MAYNDGEVIKENFAKRLNQVDGIMITTANASVLLSLSMYDTPTADVAEVVRCSECIYCENMKCTELKDNSGHPLDVAMFDYCSQGLRRDVASDVE